MTVRDGQTTRVCPTRTQLLAQARIIARHSQTTAPSVDRDNGFPEEDVELLHAGGLLTAPLRSCRGGLGLGIEAGATTVLLDVLAEIGRGNLALGRLYEGHVNALQLVQVFGTPHQVEQVAGDAQAGRLFGVWNSEDADPALGVRIERLGDRFLLCGAKTFASGAGYVTRALVTATQTDGRRQMCLVPMDRLPVSVSTDFWHPLGMRASASHKVAFNRATLEMDMLIGNPDDYTREPLFRGGALRFAAVQVGGAWALLDACRDYLRQSGRTAEPLQQERAGQAALALEGSRLWLGAAALLNDEYLADVKDRPASGSVLQSADRLVNYANLTRSAVENACLTVLELVERSVGARGLLRPHPMERLVRDLRMYLRQPASDQTLLGIGRHVLEETIPIDRLWRSETD